MIGDRDYILLYRRIMRRPQWTEEPFDTERAWIDLLLCARWKDGVRRWPSGRSVKVRRGQIPVTIRELAERWQWGKGKVERYLAGLEAGQQIGRSKSPVCTIITIINYNDYQGPRDAERDARGTLAGRSYKRARHSDEIKVKKGNNPPVVPPRSFKPRHRFHFGVPVTIPEQIELRPDMLIYAKNKGFDDEKVDHMFEHFCNNARQNDRKCKDWKAAWRNWVLKEIDMNGDPKVDPYDELFRDYKKDDSDVIDLNGRR